MFINQTLELKLMERKNFIKQFALGGSILLTAPVLFNSCSEDDDMEPTNNNNSGNEITVDLTSTTYATLGTVGGYAYKGDIIIFRTGETSYMALSKICTHQGCTVTYSHDNGNIPCACHGSLFNTGGTVLQGPAASNLKKYTVSKDGDILTIT